MPLINATNPRIIQIVRKINERYPHIDLIEIVESACLGDNDALDFLNNAPVVVRNAQRFLSRPTNNKSSAYQKYLYALAQAQMHLNREGEEYFQLKQLVTMNFQKSRQSDVFSAIGKITHKLYDDVGAQAETNLLNYMIDKLMDITLAKRKGQRMVILDINSELTSDKNGFILNCFEAEEITDLFTEAIYRSWHVNEKKDE